MTTDHTDDDRTDDEPFGVERAELAKLKRRMEENNGKWDTLSPDAKLGDVICEAFVGWHEDRGRPVELDSTVYLDEYYGCPIPDTDKPPDWHIVGEDVEVPPETVRECEELVDAMESAVETKDDERPPDVERECEVDGLVDAKGPAGESGDAVDDDTDSLVFSGGVIAGYDSVDEGDDRDPAGVVEVACPKCGEQITLVGDDDGVDPKGVCGCPVTPSKWTFDRLDAKRGG